MTRYLRRCPDCEELFRIESDKRPSSNIKCPSCNKNKSSIPYEFLTYLPEEAHS